MKFTFSVPKKYDLKAEEAWLQEQEGEKDVKTDDKTRLPTKTVISYHLTTVYFVLQMFVVGIVLIMHVFDVGQHLIDLIMDDTVLEIRMEHAVNSTSNAKTNATSTTVSTTSSTTASTTASIVTEADKFCADFALPVDTWREYLVVLFLPVFLATLISDRLVTVINVKRYTRALLQQKCYYDATCFTVVASLGWQITQDCVGEVPWRDLMDALLLVTYILVFCFLGAHLSARSKVLEYPRTVKTTKPPSRERSQSKDLV